MKDKRGLRSALFLTKNRKGQEVSPLPVVIGIILLLAVAVVLILGFTKGWQVFSFWIPSNNVQTIATQCNIACSTVNTYDFCTLTRVLVDPNNKVAPFVNGQTTGTCNDFSDIKKTEFASYKIPPCPAITTC
jgi:hypothetical protein